MLVHRPRLWIGIGVSVLAAGLALPAAAQGSGCPSPAQLPPGAGGEAGEAGEGGEGGAEAAPAARLRILDRMAAQLAGASERRAAGDDESAEILVGAATDDGPARLARLPGGPDRGLEDALAPLAAAPADMGAALSAGAAIATRIQAQPGAGSPQGRVGRAATLAGLVLEAFADARDCGQGIDRAAYAEARALALRAASLLEGLALPAAAEMRAALGQLAVLLPAAPPDPLPPSGQVSALVSRVQLAASDVTR